MARKHHSPETTSNSVVRYKGETLAKHMESSPPSVTFIRDLVGAILANWNALLQCLAFLQLSSGQTIVVVTLRRMVNSRWILFIGHRFSLYNR
jgi:hypothetical protein